MASSISSMCASLLLVFLVLQPLAATTVGELLSPVFDDVCKDVECGKGMCKASSNSAFLFECECQPGWKQTSSGHTDHLKFLPCVIPNCTLNYSCTKAPAAVEEKDTKPNETIFDPCYWSHCGSGSCNKTSKFTYNCICPADYYNLLNISSFPCFKSCELGMDCTNLGITTANQAASSTPSMADNSKNQGSSITRGHSLWPMITMVLVGMILSKYN